MKNFLALGFLLLGLGVGLGAFGAHGLRAYFVGREEEIWKTAVFYQLIHSLAVLLVVVFEKLEIITAKISLFAATAFSSGVFLFSGSLYLLVLTRERWIGAITPAGGAMMIVAWFVLAWSTLVVRAVSSHRSKTPPE